jgi:hypothetical protein
MKIHTSMLAFGCYLILSPEVLKEVCFLYQRYSFFCIVQAISRSRTNHENEHIRGIGQDDARYRKHKWVELGDGQAYDRSSD